jgi:NADPH2:quinone reductase
MNGVTSGLALFSPCGFDWPFPGTEKASDFDYKSLKMAVVGAGTNCGKIAVQFAALAGVETIIAIASLEGEGELMGFGATHVVDRRAKDVEAQVRGIVGDELLFVYDAFNRGTDHSLGVSLLSNSAKGTFVHVLSGTINEEVLERKEMGYENKPNLNGSSAAWPEFARHYWKEFPRWLADRRVKGLRHKVVWGLDAERINEVLDGYRGGNGERYHVHMKEG